MPAKSSRLKPLIAGNWKMNGLRRSRRELVRLETLLSSVARTKADVLVCPPATLLAPFADEFGKASFALGGQDCHTEADGAHTGDISAAMLRDAGAKWVILGHSERRQDHQETDRLVRRKAEAALAARLAVIACVGETWAERKSNRTLRVVERQLRGSLPGAATARRMVIAYEPVWAIGSGRTPSDDDIAEVHGHIRAVLRHSYGQDGMRMRILYGGSVKPSNAGDILKIPDVNGALVGGASLKANDFFAIVSAD